LKYFVTVAGNIGVGKSTLVSKLAEQLKWDPYFEPVTENPYLEDFYKNMKRWAFQSQVFFLTYRLRMHLEMLQNPNSVIQDRSVYEDAEIFAANLAQQKRMRKRDYASYKRLYALLSDMLRPPDLVIYLQAAVPTLQRRIAHRGRDFESGIDDDYLGQLNQLYEGWAANFALCPVLTVPTDHMDFVAHNGHLDLIVSKMKQKLLGTEEVVFTKEEVRSYAD
jgi:deoxyadenosine/deoxycytidine kinase